MILVQCSCFRLHCRADGLARLRWASVRSSAGAKLDRIAANLRLMFSGGLQYLRGFLIVHQNSLLRSLG